MHPQSPLARRTFAQLAREAGHTVTEHRDVFELGFGRVRLLLEVHKVNERAGRAACEIEALVESPSLSPPLRDEFAGVGRTPEEALSNGLAAWIAGPLEL